MFSNLHPMSTFVTRLSEIIIWGPIEALAPLPDLGKQPVGTTLLLDLKGSDLSDAPINFYVRQACVKLWEDISKEDSDVSFVSGAPGVGKSVEVYAYAMREASFHGKRVIYVHSHNDVAANLVSANRDGAKFCCMDLKSNPGQLWPFIISALEQKSVDLIVLDGQLSELIKDVFAVLKKYPGVRLISCTSFQAIKLNSEQEDRGPKFDSYIVDSWTKEEQQSAVDMKALVLDPSVSSVDEDHFYAGGSARWLQWSVARTTRTLDASLSNVDNLSLLSSVGVNVVGDASKSAQNSLMSYFRGVSSLVSEYIVGMLYFKLSASEAAELRNKNPYDPSWQGKVAELEVLKTIKLRPSITFRDEHGSYETWPRPPFKGAPLLGNFKDAKDSCFSNSSIDWYASLLFNEPCFDAIFRVRCGLRRVESGEWRGVWSVRLWRRV